MGGAALARVVGWELKDQQEPWVKQLRLPVVVVSTGFRFSVELGPPAQRISTPPPRSPPGTRPPAPVPSSLQQCWLSCAHLTHKPFLESRWGLSREPQILQPAQAQQCRHPLPEGLSGLL